MSRRARSCKVLVNKHYTAYAFHGCGNCTLPTTHGCGIYAAYDIHGCGDCTLLYTHGCGICKLRRSMPHGAGGWASENHMVHVGFTPALFWANSWIHTNIEHAESWYKKKTDLSKHKYRSY